MKNYVAILGLATLGFLTSCSSDDDSTSDNNNSSPIGNYELVSVKVSKAIDADNDGSFDDSELINFIACDSNIALNEDKTFVWGRLRTYQMQNNDEMVLYCHSYVESGNFNLTDSSLQFSTVQNETYVMNFNNNEIKFTHTEQFETSNNNMEQVLVTYIYKK